MRESPMDCGPGSAAAGQGSNPTKRLKQHDDRSGSSNRCVALSRRAAKAMADGFFRFVVRENLQQHLGPLGAGQILVLCIFHSRLSWQKGKPLELHDRDQYWIIASRRHRFPCGEGRGYAPHFGHRAILP